ncbi:MAG TPA: AI-2E family transporter [Devosia sp.]|nr:AI-2E family transporter [Devosia sp.]
MSLRNQVLVWVGFTVVVIFAIWLLRPILLPFVIGIALAYVLNPLVKQLQRWGVRRGWATAIVLLAVVAIIAGILVAVMPLIIQQIAGLVLRLPGYVGDLQTLIETMAPQLSEWLGPERAAQVETALAQMLGTGVEFVVGIATQLAQSSLTVLNTIAVIIITPVVAFYLLLDWEAMGRGLDDLLPREHRREIRTVLDQIDRAMAGVVRGQGGVILVDCIFYATALSLVGLNFGLVIGLMIGLLSFVPFLGFITGFVLSIGIAVVQFAPNWVPVVLVLAVFIVGQFLEGNVLYPKLVGQSININPVWLMFSLFAFAFLFGFVGLLLAVPLAAISAVLTRYAVKRYRESTLYQGTDRGPKPASPAAAEAAAPRRTRKSKAAAPE